MRELTQIEFDVQSNWKVFYFIRSRRIDVNAEPRRTNERSQIGMHKLHGMNRHVFRDIRRKARVPLEKCYWEGHADKWHLSWNGRVAKMSRDHCYEAMNQPNLWSDWCVSAGCEIWAVLPGSAVLHFMSTSGRSQRVKRSWCGNFMGNLIVCALWEISCDFSIDPRKMRVDSFPRTQLINVAGCDFLWLRLHDGFRRWILLTGIYYKFLARTFLLWRALTGVGDNNFGRNYPSQSVGWVTFYWKLSIFRVLAKKLISCWKKLAK